MRALIALAVLMVAPLPAWAWRPGNTAVLNFGQTGCPYFMATRVHEYMIARDAEATRKLVTPGLKV